MKKIVLFITILFSCLSTTTGFAQKLEQKPFKIYNPEANAAIALQNAIKNAASSQKQVLVFVGGNWCVWCVRLDKFINSNDSLMNLIKDNYEVVHINYSPEQKNLPTLKKLKNPQKMGFPVLVILDEKGNIIHTQNTGLLEEANGYSLEKVQSFLTQWKR